MQALKEIGIRKALRFLLSSLWNLFFQILLFPQFRVIWLRLGGAKIGSGTIIHQVLIHNIYHTGLSNLEIGKNCFVGNNVSFDLAEKIKLENDVSVAEGVIFSTHLKVGYKNHPLEHYFPPYKAPINIKQGAFVGVGSIILAGTTIGACSFIAAGCRVSGLVPEWTLVKTAAQNHFVLIKKPEDRHKI